MSEQHCPSTMGYAREGIRCTRARDHIGRHAGKGWVWWRGNGETEVPTPDPAAGESSARATPAPDVTQRPDGLWEGA